MIRKIQIIIQVLACQKYVNIKIIDYNTRTATSSSTVILPSLSIGLFNIGLITEQFSLFLLLPTFYFHGFVFTPLFIDIRPTVLAMVISFC